MEILERIQVFRRWLWLIVLVGLVFAVGGYLIRVRQPPVYQTSARLLIGSFVFTPNPDTQQVQTGIELVKTYAELAHTYDILEQTVQTYNLPVDAEELRLRTRTVISAQAPILEIIATYSDPAVAAQMANGLAEQLVSSSPDRLTVEQQNQRASIQAQIALLNEQLTESRAQLQDVFRRDSAAYTLESIERLRDERLTLTSHIVEISGIIADLTVTLAGIQERTNLLSIIERARVPATPIGASVTVIAGLGFVVGAMLTAGAVLALDELDQTMKSSTRVKRFTGLPVLSSIRLSGVRREASPHWLIAAENPLSPAAEAYRMLQSRLLYSSREIQKVYVFTSPGEDEGSSITVANLAVTMAAAGFQVLVVDACLRNPEMHRIFDVEDSSGLVKLVSMAPEELNELSDTAAQERLAPFIRPTKVPDVFVLPRGKLQDAAAIAHTTFRLPQLVRWIDVVRARYGIDTVIFDTAPCLVSSESLVLAGALPVEIVLVVEAGRTRREEAREAIEQFSETGSPVRGVVLNII